MCYFLTRRLVLNLASRGGSQVSRCTYLGSNYYLRKNLIMQDVPILTC
jgi:hypothetical protein